MSLNASAQRVGAFSFARALVAGTWTGCSFALAQLAEGYSVNAFVTLLFGLAIAMIAGRMRTHFGYGIFLMSSVALSAVMVSSLGYGTSLQQFFPNVWGPIDYMLVLLLWSSPLMSFMVTRCERKVARWMQLSLQKFLRILPAVVLPKVARHQLQLWLIKFSNNSITFSRQHPRRGPPSLVVL